jgi:threonine dehydrogenase-like Zn-dependent dehydrogenase
MTKAWRLVDPRVFETVEMPVPRIPREDKDGVLVRSEWAALCGSDIAFFAGSKRYRSYPLEPGAPIHECVGASPGHPR